MRGFLSGLTAVLAALVLPLAITAVWTAERVTDTEGYVGAVGPLADDPEVQEALTDRLERYAVELVGLEALPEPTQDPARSAVRKAVTAVVTSDGFRPVWEDANRAGHDELIRTLRQDLAGEIRPLDLATVVDSVTEALRQVGLPLGDVDPPGLVLNPEPRQLRAAQEGYQALDAARTLLPLLWVALVVITLVVARRRLRSLAVLAGASVVSAALMWPVLRGLRSAAVDSTPDADRELAGVVWDGVTASLETTVLVAVAVSAAVLVVAVVLDAVAGRSARAVS